MPTPVFSCSQHWRLGYDLLLLCLLLLMVMYHKFRSTCSDDNGIRRCLRLSAMAAACQVRTHSRPACTATGTASIDAQWRTAGSLPLRMDREWPDRACGSD